MGYANCIGRVGGLAVALGVGMAVANSGIAYADDGDSGNATASGDTTVSKSASARGARTAARPAAPAASDTAARAPKAAAAAAPAKRGGSDNAAARASATRIAPRPSVPVETGTPAPAVSLPDTSTPAPIAPSSPSAALTTATTAPGYALRRPAASFAQRTANPMASATGASQWLRSLLSPLFGSNPLNNQGLSTLMWSVAAFARREFTKIAQKLGVVSATANTTLTMSPNLLLNPGAEIGDASLSGNSAVTIPGWTLTGTPTVIGYGTPRNLWPMGLPFATPNLPSFMGFPKTPPGSSQPNTQFFGGGNVATSTLTQLVDLGSAQAAGVTYNLSGYLGGYLFDPSSASVKVDFLDSNKAYLGSKSIGPVSVFERLFETGFKQRTATGTLPTGTQYAQVTLNLVKKNPQRLGFQADYNAAFADEISFTVSSTVPGPDPDKLIPPSTVGQLDHAFMVYMENKGYDDIVGSPNAPFLNSLINAYGFATNYYGLTHPSLPNYYPILGGSDFGKTYNCKDACIDAPMTLMERLDDAGKTWRSYAQGFEAGMNPLTSQGEYAVDETAFPAYTYFANNLDYAKEHLVPIEQMAIDLQSTASTPSYAWFAADENSNGEGPVDFPWGMLKFALSQITPGHQYNVKGLDNYLAEYVPVILNSCSWKNDCEDTVTPKKSALFITFDEDNNNTSLGFGNEGNHIVTVVIPNQAAIDAGMRGGAFTDSTHYNHYSLLRTIELALGLEPMTNNDKYAVPMNGFWNTSFNV